MEPYTSLLFTRKTGGEFIVEPVRRMLDERGYGTSKSRRLSSRLRGPSRDHDLVPADIQVPRLRDPSRRCCFATPNCSPYVIPICLWSADAWQGAGGFALWLKVD
jgi:hypothetical protein